MLSARQPIIANDNLPLRPSPAPVDMTIQARVRHSHAAHDPRVIFQDSPQKRFHDRLIALLIVWTLCFGAAIGLVPGILAFPAIISCLIAAGLTAVAGRSESRFALAMATMALAFSVGTAIQLSSETASIFVWGSALIVLWLVQCALAIRLASNINSLGLAATLALGCGACWWVVTNNILEAGVFVAALSVLGLGSTRRLSKSRIGGAAGAYLFFWLATVAGGVLGSQGLLPEMFSSPLRLACLVLVLSSITVWGLQGLHAMGQIVVISGIVALFLIPDAELWLSGQLQAFDSQALAPIFAACAVMAAACALAIRGVVRQKPAMILLGAAVLLAQALLIIAPQNLNADTGVMIMAGFAFMLAWLLSARLG